MGKKKFGEPVSGHKLHRDDHGHEARVDELSENDAIHQDDMMLADWEEETNLVAPEPNEGYTQRWVRVSLNGADDPKNMHKKFRQGWRARSVDNMDPSFKELGTKKAWDEGILRVDDLVLMEIPTARIDKRREYFSNKTSKLMLAVDNELQNAQVAGNPISQNNRSEVSKPKRRVAPAED